MFRTTTNYYFPNPLERGVIMAPNMGLVRKNRILYNNWHTYVSDIIVTTILCLIEKKIPIYVIRDVIFPKLKIILDINLAPCASWFKDDDDLDTKYRIEYRKREQTRNKLEKEKRRRKKIADMIKFEKSLKNNKR